MNKQGPKGIEWTTYTHNVLGGCFHDCQWLMTDRSVASCYAGDVANGVARAAYPEGFKHHYFHPERLDDPLKVKEPSRIFIDSMADMFGHWVPDEQIKLILDSCRKAHWHTFQSLTKNAPRLLKFADLLPPNLWVGVSMPPTYMNGKRLSSQMQDSYMMKALNILAQISFKQGNVTWMSLEPLSFDVSAFIKELGGSLDWLVIGAASNGRTKYQPAREHVQALLNAADLWDIPVFMKGNLTWEPRREEYPQP